MQPRVLGLASHDEPVPSPQFERDRFLGLPMSELTALRVAILLRNPQWSHPNPPGRQNLTILTPLGAFFFWAEMMGPGSTAPI